MERSRVPRRNIVNVSWGDHLIFGEGDGRLATPDAVARRLVVWRHRLGAAAIHWRMLRSRIPYRFLWDEYAETNNVILPDRVSGY